MGSHFFNHCSLDFFSKVLFASFVFLISGMLFGEQTIDEMLNALDTAAYWDKKLCERFPYTFNHLLSTGYFTTPSARMTEEGEFGVGIADIPPYLHLNARIQPFSQLEFSVNYRIFRGIEDAVMGKFGFGDYADRGANFKYALFTPEQSLYALPGIAFGIDDFMGSKKFTTYYVVGTQVWPDWGFEISFGWGAGRYTRGSSRGFFGGFNWFPLWNLPECAARKWFGGISLTAEVDPTNYEEDPHPHGRNSSTPINFGMKYNLGKLIETSASYVRGQAVAFAGSFHYNWGKTEGFLPKIKDPLPYTSPKDVEPLGCTRSESLMIQSINYALEQQGFQLTRAWIDKSNLSSRLFLVLINCRYRQENLVRSRLQYLLASLAPSNVSEIVVAIEAYGLPLQQYIYSRELLLRYAAHCISPFEFEILTPREEFCSPAQKLSSDLIFQKRYDLWKGKISPRFESFFGSAGGKFKYDFGLKADLEGFLPHNWYYEFQFSYTLFSTLKGIGDYDIFHPSQLPNVATDYIRYRQTRAFTWDKLYLQKSWNFGRGIFGRLAGGYFQVNYAGLAAEMLWYPVRSCLAIGLDGAVVEKRSYAGFGFQTKLRHFEGRMPVYRNYTSLQQYFLSLYMDFPSLSIFTKFSAGQFLARDKGVRLEATRYFANGVRISGWITYTDAHDQIHGENYYDRGVAVEIPIDFFHRCSNRRVWNYGMAAWLRDAGYSTTTGKPLFEIINRERRW